MRFVFLFMLISLSASSFASSLENNFWIYTQVKTKANTNRIISLAQFRFLNESIVNNEIIYAYSVSTYYDKIKPEADEIDTAYFVQNNNRFSWTSAKSKRTFNFKIEWVVKSVELFDKANQIFEHVETLERVLGQPINIFYNDLGQELKMIDLKQPFLELKTGDTIYKQIDFDAINHFEEAIAENRVINNRPHFVEGDSFVINQYTFDNYFGINHYKQYYYASKQVASGAYVINQYELNCSDWPKYVKKEKIMNLTLNDSGYNIGSNFTKYTTYQAYAQINTLYDNNELRIGYPKPIFVHPTKKDTIWAFETLVITPNKSTNFIALTTYPLLFEKTNNIFVDLKHAYAKVNDVYKPYISLIPLDTIDTKNNGVQDMYIKDGKLYLEVYYASDGELDITIAHKNKDVYKKNYGIITAKELSTLLLDFKVQDGKMYDFIIEFNSELDGTKSKQMQRSSFDTFKKL